jgi:hypothetical protein
LITSNLLYFGSNESLGRIQRGGSTASHAMWKSLSDQQPLAGILGRSLHVNDKEWTRWCSWEAAHNSETGVLGVGKPLMMPEPAVETECAKLSSGRSAGY